MAAIVVTLGAVAANQVKVYRARQARAAVVQQRQALFEMLHVLLVSKRLAAVDPSRTPRGLHPPDAPNDSSVPDCQPAMP